MEGPFTGVREGAKEVVGIGFAAERGVGADVGEKEPLGGGFGAELLLLKVQDYGRGEGRGEDANGESEKGGAGNHRAGYLSGLDWGAGFRRKSERT